MIASKPSSRKEKKRSLSSGEKYKDITGNYPKPTTKQRTHSFTISQELVSLNSGYLVKKEEFKELHKGLRLLAFDDNPNNQENMIKEVRFKVHGGAQKWPGF